MTLTIPWKKKSRFTSTRPRRLVRPRRRHGGRFLHKGKPGAKEGTRSHGAPLEGVSEAVLPPAAAKPRRYVIPKQDSISKQRQLGSGKDLLRWNGARLPLVQTGKAALCC